MTKSNKIQEALMMDSFNCASDTIYSKENFDSLFNRWCDLSVALQAIADAFGPTVGSWKIERMSAKKVQLLKALIEDALTSYVAREEYLSNNPDVDVEVPDDFSMFDLLAFFIDPDNDAFEIDPDSEEVAELEMFEKQRQADRIYNLTGLMPELEDLD